MSSDPVEIRRELERHLLTATGKFPDAATERDWLMAAAGLAREALAGRWAETRRGDGTWRDKRVCYLSIEFLLGRLLTDTLRNLGLYQSVRAAFAQGGLDLADIAEAEIDPALGNGGLGRLAACYLDSLATLGIPATGYGLRFEYGLFNQGIERGWQVEKPEHWLRHGNPWEFPRTDEVLRVPFQGHVAASADGQLRQWLGTEDVFAVPYDMPVVGYGAARVNTLRLWAARAHREFDFALFHEGQHLNAIEPRARWENLTRVLYPGDANEAGRRLRFMQQYFFVSASVQDILRGYLAGGGRIDALPDKVAIAINDTHPALVVPELIRLLQDEHGLDRERAWSITQRTVCYTNHTLMPEALETWPVRFFEELLPRHLEIVYGINERLLELVRRRVPHDGDLVRRVSVIDEGGERRVRMAHVAFAGSHRINGVSELHTHLLRISVFADLARVFPNRIVNVTNGITPRRWLADANPDLAALITRRIGGGWLTDLSRLASLAPLAEDAGFRAEFRAVKHANKARLAKYLTERCGLFADPGSLFDMQVKRIHEYKRQVLKVLHAVTLYNRIKAGRGDGILGRTVIFAGKAASGYLAAKLTIKLANDVARTVNEDPACHGRLRVLFVPNYSVSVAERLIPAADLSEQISTAGTEASGTGNMKLALNGALTIGTFDGANVEIARAVGKDNIFLFGLFADEAVNLHAHGYEPHARYFADVELRNAIDAIANGVFSPDDHARFRPITDGLLHHDRYLVLADYAAYMTSQGLAEAVYRDVEEWSRRAILNVAHMGALSSDRAISEYAGQIWGVAPAPRAATLAAAE